MSSSTPRPRRLASRIRDALAATTLARLALGVVYFHFGLLKFFPDLSPAEMLASQTILRLGFTIDASEVLFVLGALECTIGALLLFGFRRLGAALMLGHIVGTMSPLWVLPELSFKFAPFAPTIEGQYILKNLVFAAVGVMLLAERRQPLEASQARPDHADSSHAPVSDPVDHDAGRRRLERLRAVSRQ